MQSERSTEATTIEGGRRKSGSGKLMYSALIFTAHEQVTIPFQVKLEPNSVNLQTETEQPQKSLKDTRISDI